VAATITTTPIADGREPDWRVFISELQGPRRIEWAQSQRRRGVTREVVAVADGDPVLAIVYAEATDPSAAAEMLASSDDPFDVWYRERVAELHDGAWPTEVVFDSAPKPGPWRGWR